MSLKLVLGAAALGTLTLLTTSFVGSVQEDDAPAPGMDMALMMEMMRLAQPGPEHEQLAERVGDWRFEASMFMTPGSDPVVSGGTATTRTVLGGRFVETETSGTMMGMPIATIGYVGFDRRRDVYTTIGMDTMGTYWVTAEGVEEADGIVRMHGVDDSRFGKQVYTFEIEDLGADEYTVSVIFKQQGPIVYDPPFTMVSMRYTRAGDGGDSE